MAALAGAQPAAAAAGPVLRMGGLRHIEPAACLPACLPARRHQHFVARTLAIARSAQLVVHHPGDILAPGAPANPFL
jgi:hypothetical protein